MKCYLKRISLASCIAILPALLQAQTIPSTRRQLNLVLENVQSEMLQDVDKLIAISMGIGGFGALFYIGYRVWKQIAAAEPIDFFPLFRPFCLALCIGIFPTILDIMEGLLRPVTLVTEQIAENSSQAVEVLLDRNDHDIVYGNDNAPITTPGVQDEAWRKYVRPDITDPKDDVTSGTGFSFGLNMITNSVTYLVKLLISKVLEVAFFAASLCINTVRTFHLVILSILGPLVFAFSIYDGLHHTLSIWIGRYINIYLWLPICNLFSTLINRIQINMLNIDKAQQETAGMTMFTQTDLVYMVFLVIAIVGYFSIPSIANFIVHASGESAIMRKVTTMVRSGTNTVISGISSFGGGGGSGGFKGGGMSSGRGSMAADMPGPDVFRSPMTDAYNSEPYLSDNYQYKKLKG